MSRIYGVALGAVALTMWQSAPAQTSQAPAAISAKTGVYKIDPAQSEVRLLVFHGGRIGHDHVIINRNITGQVNFTGQPETSSFSLVIPVKDFDVDDPDARSSEGTAESSDFAKTFSAGERSDTKEHMLGPKLLDGAHFATITAKSTAVTAAPDGFTAAVAVDVAGHQSTLQVHFLLDNTSGLSATGSTHLRQTELGLVPLSFMMGAVTVKDEIVLKFKLVAVEN